MYVFSNSHVSVLLHQTKRQSQPTERCHLLMQCCVICLMLNLFFCLSSYGCYQITWPRAVPNFRHLPPVTSSPRIAVTSRGMPRLNYRQCNRSVSCFAQQVPVGKMGIAKHITVLPCRGTRRQSLFSRPKCLNNLYSALPER